MRVGAHRLRAEDAAGPDEAPAEGAQVPAGDADGFASMSGNALNAAAVEEILNTSLAQKKGMSIYMGGQTINCVFVKRIDGNTIEVRNQQFGRVVLRIDRIDAIALS